jgi:hypothetical protein
MTTGPALPCPNCKRVLGPESWIDAHDGVCLKCETEFEFTAFPALTAAKEKVAPQTAVLAADSVCFFHAENRAETICDGCGRLLCPVCTIAFAGQRVCPACMAANKKSDAAPVVRQRTLFDSLAMILAILPLLIWPFTCITAPAALGLVIYGWNKPGSVVRGRGRVRLVIAGLLALIQIGVWVTVITLVVLKD